MGKFNRFRGRRINEYVHWTQVLAYYTMIMPIGPLYLQWRKREFDQIAWDAYVEEASPLPKGFESTPEQRMFVEFLRIERNLKENEEFLTEFNKDLLAWKAQKREEGVFKW